MGDQYYYADGNDREGPVDLAALRTVGITRNTLVWRGGLTDWPPAGELPELAGFFELPGVAAAPPPVPEARPSAQPSTSPLDGRPRAAASAPLPTRHDDLGRTAPPKTWLVESIVATILCCLPFGIAGIVNASPVESRFYAGDYEGAERASRQAAKWTKVSAGVALAGYVLDVVFAVLVGVGSSF